MEIRGDFMNDSDSIIKIDKNLNKINEYKTFFSPRYIKTKETNTYSGYRIEYNSGIWIYVMDNEESSNYSKKCVYKIMENYIENNEYSVANMERLLNIGNETIINMRIRENKDYKMNFSITIIIISNNKMIVGNIGNNIVNIRDRKTGKIIKITNNSIKQLKLKSRENIVIGNNKFWKNVKNLSLKDNDIYCQNKCEYLFAKLTSKKEDYANNFINIDVKSVINISELNKENNTLNLKKERENKGFLWVTMVLICSFLFGFNLHALVQLNESKRMLSSMAKDLKYFEFKSENLSQFDINTVQNNLINKILEEKKNSSKNENESNVSYEIENIQFEKSSDNNNEKNKIISETKNHNTSVIKKATKSKNSKEKIVLQKLLDLDREIEENWRILGRDKFGNEIVDSKMEIVNDIKNE